MTFRFSEMDGGAGYNFGYIASIQIEIMYPGNFVGSSVYIDSIDPVTVENTQKTDWTM